VVLLFFSLSFSSFSKVFLNILKTKKEIKFLFSLSDTLLHFDSKKVLACFDSAKNIGRVTIQTLLE